MVPLNFISFITPIHYETKLCPRVSPQLSNKPEANIFHFKIILVFWRLRSRKNISCEFKDFIHHYVTTKYTICVTSLYLKLFRFRSKIICNPAKIFQGIGPACPVHIDRANNDLTGRLIVSNQMKELIVQLHNEASSSYS